MPRPTRVELQLSDHDEGLQQMTFPPGDLIGLTPDELRREVTECRAAQQAVFEVLAIIGRSGGDTKPVLEAICAAGARLCDADRAVIHLRVGARLDLAAAHGTRPERQKVLASLDIERNRTSVIGRTVLGRATVHVEEVARDVAGPLEVGVPATVLSVPLSHEGDCVGAITLARDTVRPFSRRHINLIETFAAQAVIAIENARLFEAEQTRTKEVESKSAELVQSLEHQTAVGEVLRSIAHVPFDLKGVLQSIVEVAGRLCGSARTYLLLMKEGELDLAAYSGFSAEFMAVFMQDPAFKKPGSVARRVLHERKTLHIPDTRADQLSQVHEAGPSIDAPRTQSILGVPLFCEGNIIGMIGATHTIVKPFTDRQIALIETFADQAVIAIENARLFEAERARTKEVEAKSAELQESLEYQTATSEVLGVISKSPSELQPILHAITVTAARLCEAEFSMFFSVVGQECQLAASNSANDDFTRYMIEHPVPLLKGSNTSRAALEGRTIHVADVLADPDYIHRKVQKVGGQRTVLCVPLMRDGVAVGVITTMRSEVRPFTDRQVALVETFANQAIIAINNVGLFEEVQTRTKEVTEALEYQTATSEVLGVISRSPNELQPVLDAIAETANRICEADYALVFSLQDAKLHLESSSGADPDVHQWLAERPLAPDRNSVAGRAIVERQTVHLPDVLADQEFSTFDRQQTTRARTSLGVPLLRGSEPIGVIVLVRAHVRPFDRRQVDLVTTFASQAVIAINNVGLFEEVQTRTRELQAALDRQTGTSEVLRIISSSRSDLKPVMNAVLENATRLCDAKFGNLFLVEGEAFRHVAMHGAPPAFAELRQREPIVQFGPTNSLAKLAQTKAPIHVVDLTNTQSYLERHPASVQIVELAGARSLVTVPLLKDEKLIGAMGIYRQEVRPFTDQEIAVVVNFADQAVIAIENARLLDELQTRQKELEGRTRELEIASKHKSQFVANMSHELRTPLAAILGYAELLQQGIYGPLSEKSSATIGRMHSNGTHLLGLINTVLDISKIEAGQLALNLAEYSMTSLIETVRVATESLARNKRLALVTEAPPGMPRGHGDETRLNQVLVNLVGNAIKFTDAGEVRITARVEGGEFLIAVRDTGPGIPEAEQARIFEEFHQVDSTSTRTKGGTGLGLTIAKRIVELHGGTLTVQSRLGEGATFHLRLPVRTARA